MSRARRWASAICRRVIGPTDWTAPESDADVTTEGVPQLVADDGRRARTSKTTPCCPPPCGARESESPTRLPENGVDLRAHLTLIERSLISQALQRSGGTVAHAARLLSLRRTTLVEKLRKLGMAGA